MKIEDLNPNKGRTNIYSIKDFKGVDYAHAQANVSLSRSSSGLNMVRSEVGKVRKRTGYAYDAASYPGRINGVHILKTDGGEICLIHSKNSFYLNGVAIYTLAKDEFSHSVQMGEKLYIVEGEHYLMFDGKTLVDTAENAYIPTIYIRRHPDGYGGEKYQQINLLSPKRTEAFVVDGRTSVFYMSEKNLDNNMVHARVINPNDHTEKEYTTDNGLIVNAALGQVSFLYTPLASLPQTESSVFITYSKSGKKVPGGMAGCKVMKAYGKGGKPDTIFLSGNPLYPNRDWFSVPDDPTYFGEENVGIMGLDNGEIVGYSIKDDLLFTHKRNGEGGVNIFVRTSGTEQENYRSYPIISTVQGPGACAAGSFATLLNEPLFLTGGGIYGIAQQDANVEQYTQLRSLFINPHLLKNPNLQDCYSCIFNDFYVLCAGENLYLLDGLQKNTEKDGDFSRYQYECYHWKIKPVRVIFTQGNRLCFGTAEGKIGRFFTDEGDPLSYSDEGLAISAHWQTPDFTADMPWKTKNIHKIWLVCASDVHTSASLWARQKGVLRQLFFDETTCRYFRFSKLNFSKFTWSCDKTPRLIKRDVRLKGVDKLALSIENNQVNEPFGLYEVGFEYTLAEDVR
ncbi:MAG: hypothetical protein RR253_02060 [Oscillospiraceae bacterium]